MKCLTLTELLNRIDIGYCQSLATLGALSESAVYFLLQQSTIKQFDKGDTRDGTDQLLDRFYVVLTGESLFAIADGEQPKRWIVSEYHDGGLPTGSFMVVKEQWKYIYYPGYRPQLFNLSDDPMEDIDLAEDPEYAAVLQECDVGLGEVLDPDKVNDEVFAKQAAIVEKFGGYDKIANMDESNMFIELDALYVNSEELITPVEENTRRKIR